MAIQTTTFKGARYIVKFHDPIEWNSEESYEAIESVKHNGFTYISKQPVPAGVEITNEDFWLLWADPNAQMEELRRLVSQYVDNVEELSGVVGDLSNELGQEIEARQALEIKTKSAFGYKLTEYKEETDPDYTAAWNRIIAMINTENGGSIIVSGNERVDGTFVLNAPNVSIYGGGTFESPITIDCTSSEPSNINIYDINFDIDTADACIYWKHGFAISISMCNFVKGTYGICSTENVEFQQMLRQGRITNNHFYTDYGIFLVPATNENDFYLAADLIISDNTFNNVVENIVIDWCDGVNVTSNVLFLTRNNTTKRNNINVSNCSFSIINGNEIFEAGKHGIMITDSMRFKIANNNIIWPGQLELGCGISINSPGMQEFTIIGNSIIDPSSHGIYANSGNYNVYDSNKIFSPGSSDHWKASSAHPSGTYYGITDAQSCIVSVGNFSTNKNNFPNNANGLILELQGYNNRVISERLINPKAVNLFTATGNKNDDYTIDAFTPMIINVGTNTISKADFACNFSGYLQPKFGIVKSFNGTITIGDHVIASNTAESFVIYGNDISWL